MGELIRQVEKAKSRHEAKRRTGRGSPTRKSAAADAGISRDQANEAKAMSRPHSAWNRLFIRCVLCVPTDPDQPLYMRYYLIYSTT